MKETVESLDTDGVHVTPTYHPDFEKNWGYAVQGRFRFVREEANYTSRHAAEQAGIRSGIWVREQEKQD